MPRTKRARRAPVQVHVVEHVKGGRSESELSVGVELQVSYMTESCCLNLIGIGAYSIHFDKPML